eukprot:Gregarina_sp_Poly_1__11162@NODE_908_length_5757_cov_78_501406_g647_i0_p4_GENE_NODE_908_length_5757_cov_78_501406_g647_i0NODE_908_length_5757_cov_78_501406_g647_i0_p4_ORF_typecomplete_len164_score14_42UPF0086/PF01868_16/6e15_NODE_908_length_5757_cov_78_501406_g647_i017892280
MSAKPSRLWLDSRKIRGLDTEDKSSKKIPLPPKPCRARTHLKPLSAQALQAIQQLWQNYAGQANRNTAVKIAMLGQMELVGAQVTVLKSSNPSNVLLSGVVIDESENMLYMQCGNRIVQIAKQGCHFELNMNGERMVLLGQGIDRSVTNRTKAKRRKITNILV